MKKKSTKSALLMSFTSLLLCFAMLIGCTFAWFTDSVSSGVNKIVAGNLDIDVQYAVPGTGGTLGEFNPMTKDTNTLFGTALWEPGHTEYVTLKIENKGTLALNYKVMVTPVTEKGGVNVNGQSFKLSDYLVFGTKTETTVPSYTNREAARSAITGGIFTLNQPAGSGTMQAKAAGAENNPTEYVTLVVYMPEEIGNVANYKTGTAAPEIELGVTVVATQLQSEEDSFGNTYDAGAIDETNGASEYVVGPVYDYFPQVVKSVAVTKDTTTNKVTEQATIEVKESEEEEGAQVLASVTVPVGVQLKENTTELTLKVTPQAPTPETVESEGLAVEVEDANREIANFDIKIEGVDSSNTEPITVKVFVGKGLSNVKIYHDGVEITGATYNSGSGIAEFTTTSFSDYTVAYDVVCARIGEETYGSLALAFDAAQSGETVTLLKDINVGDAIAYENTGTVQTWNVFENGAVTLDGDGHKLSGSAVYVLGFDRCEGAITIKNLTVEGTSTSNTAAINLTGCYDVTLENVKASGVKTGVIVNNSVATIKGANTNIANGAWHAVNVDAGGTGGYETTGQPPKLTIEGGKIGAIVCERTGSANITGGTIEGVAGKDGTAGKEFTGAINISGGTINAVGKTGSTGTIAITGGTFSSDPSAYVPTGYKTIEADGKWTVGQELVAEVGGEKYFSLQEALNAANDGDTVKLLADVAGSVSASSEVAFTISKSITLDGNDKTMFVTGDSASDTYGIYVNAEEAIQATIENLTLNTTGTERAIRFGGKAGGTVKDSKITSQAVGIHVKGTGEVTIDNVDITVDTIAAFTAHKRAGVVVGAETTATMTDSKIVVNAGDKTDDKLTWGKGAYVGTDAKGKLILDNTDITADFALAIDGSQNSSKLNNITVNSGTIKGDLGSPSGCSYKEIVITGGTFNPYSVNGLNGGFYDKDNATARMEIFGGTFSTQPEAKYIPDGYMCVGMDGKFVVDQLKTELNSKEDLLFFAAAVNSGANVAGKTVTLTADIDLNGVDWTPIYCNGMNWTFDGNNKTITNLKIEGDKGVGLFNYGNGLTVKNLTVDSAVVHGINQVGVIFGQAMCVTIDNCTVKNSKIVAEVYNNDDGDKAGAIAGYLTAQTNASLTNCSVENCSITGYRDVGGLVGYAQFAGAIVSNNAVKNTTVTNARTNNYKNYTADAEYDVGEIIGQNDGASASNNTATNVTITVVPPAAD